MSLYRMPRRADRRAPPPPRRVDHAAEARAAAARVAPRRARVLDALHHLAGEAGLTLWLTDHFLTRLDVRGADPGEALTAFEVAARRLIGAAGRTLDGRKGRVAVGDFTFVVDLQRPRRLAFVTFWGQSQFRSTPHQDELLLTID
jgi:hypothetical protein